MSRLWAGLLGGLILAWLAAPSWGATDLPVVARHDQGSRQLAAPGDAAKCADCYQNRLEDAAAQPARSLEQP